MAGLDPQFLRQGGQASLERMLDIAAIVYTQHPHVLAGRAALALWKEGGAAPNDSVYHGLLALDGILWAELMGIEAAEGAAEAAPPQETNSAVARLIRAATNILRPLFNWRAVTGELPDPTVFREKVEQWRGERPDRMAERSLKLAEFILSASESGSPEILRHAVIALEGQAGEGFRLAHRATDPQAVRERIITALSVVTDVANSRRLDDLLRRHAPALSPE